MSLSPDNEKTTEVTASVCTSHRFSGCLVWCTSQRSRAVSVPVAKVKPDGQKHRLQTSSLTELPTVRSEYRYPVQPIHDERESVRWDGCRAGSSTHPSHGSRKAATIAAEPGEAQFHTCTVPSEDALYSSGALGAKLN